MGNRCCTKKIEAKTRIIYPSSVVHLDEVGAAYNPNADYANNRLKTTKYSILTFLPLNLWEQFHRFANVYFVFIVVLNFMPGISAFAKEVAPIPVVLTLTVIAVKDAYEDFRRHLSDRRINRKKCKVFSRDEARYVETKWENLLPGDFVRLHTNEMIPADILLLKSSNVAGICHIETANLDGESNLKQREVVDRRFFRETFSPLQFTYSVEVEAPSAELYNFNGKIIRGNDDIPIRKHNMILRGCVLRNTDSIEGMVIYAGQETKAALNNTGPRFKRSRLEKLMNRDVIWCVLILVVVCITGAIGSGVWQANLPGDDVLFVALDRNATTSSPAFQGFLNFWRFIILFQSIIPLPLYVSIELIKLHQVWHMNHDLALYDPDVDRRVEVRAFNILEDLGQVEYVFCDKTGTLTENKMEFKMASIGGVEYSADMNFASTLQSSDQIMDRLNMKDFNALDQQVKQMSLLTTTQSEAAQTDVHDSVISTDLNILKHHKSFIDDFILILAICNTVVVSATKNTATFFQIPNRRRGLRALLRRSPSKEKMKRKSREKRQTTGVRQARSFSALRTRRRRRGKPTPPIEPHKEEEERRYPTDGSTSVPRVQFNQPSFEYHDATSSPQDKEPIEGASNALRSTDATLPPIVQGLTLDVPNRGALRIGRSASPRKSGSVMGIQRADLTGHDTVGDVDSDAESSVSLEGPMAQPSTLSQTENDSDTSVEQSLSRKMTVIAHDGSAYDLPVSEDYEPDNGTGSNACPLPDNLLLKSYESESPDEVTLVRAACRQGCKLLQRGLDFVLLWLPSDGLVGVRVLHTLPFDSNRKRMSIIIRHPATDEIIMYTKGADSAILGRVKCMTNEENELARIIRHQLDTFSRAGLRTLVMAKRVIPEDEYNPWAREYSIAEATASDTSQLLQNLMDRIERDFTLVGATGIEDQLQPGVPETIDHLREAGIHVWVLTGDKQETAVNVARSARLITDEHRIIFINALTKFRTGHLITCYLHSLLCGQPWPDMNAVEDVMSDTPDRGVPSSESSSESADETAHVQPVMNHKDVHRPSRIRRILKPGSNGDRRRMPRSLSESRTSNKRPKRRLGRPHIRHCIRHSVKREQLADTSKLALVIDGETLQFVLDGELSSMFAKLARLCSSVICCRSTPWQKAAVVELVKAELSAMTLAVGDGANDVNMIQSANVGVGISGQEGMQAVMASDFAISRFRFLKRLVLVHGHMCYDKLAHTALYLFYKDAVYIFLLFWYQMFNGFSGSNAVDQLSQILFAVTFTSVPSLVMGIWDNPTHPELLLNNPILYRYGIEGKAYRPWLFWLNIVDAVWQSLILFFVPYMFYADSSMTIWRFGLLQTHALVLCSLLHAALVTRTWCYIHAISFGVSYIVAYLVFTIAYHSLALTGIAPESPYHVMFVAMADGAFWVITLLTLVLALMPRFLFIALRNTLAPTLDTVATLLSKKHGTQNRLPLEPYSHSFSAQTALERQHSASVHSTFSTQYSTAPGPSQPSLGQLEHTTTEKPGIFIAQLERLLSVSSQLFGVTPTPTTEVFFDGTVTAQTSMPAVNWAGPQRIVDRRRRNRRALTLNLRLPRRLHGMDSAVQANNFDDGTGLPSTPAIWPVVDPTVRYRSFSTGRQVERPPLDVNLFSRQTPNVQDPEGMSESRLQDPPPPYYPPTTSAPPTR